MKSIVTLFACVATGAILHAQPHPAVKDIVAAYETIEREHENWDHYNFAEAGVDESYVRQYDVWLSSVEEMPYTKVQVVNHSEHGSTGTVSYLKNDQLVFVLATRSKTPFTENAKTSVSESRYYFDGGKVVRLLEKGGQVPPDQADDLSKLKSNEVPMDKIENPVGSYHHFHKKASFVIARLKKITEELRSNEDGEDAVDAAGTGDEVKPGAKVKDGPLQTTTGTFLGFDQGDYYHWKMKNEKGDEVTYFIWESGPEIDEIETKMNHYIGKKCRVTWRTSTVNIPENGGDTEVEKLVKFEWIK